MMLDHHTRLGIAREHAHALRETMLASKRPRYSDGEARRGTTAQIYTFPRPGREVGRGATA
jgi:hypothetical protein